ncbi:MAG: 50S ribosomal protein L18 [Alloalcanivorax venustensis]|jgi:large subunit ribosomal protein L18|nr:50S ribosomal protein L18 [Alloalcanivorax venustensis]MAD70010.1 50S ribosomal protein L18 [Alcanivorax sp.]MCH9783388.1 50S ribosomal protein L18 [Gammaproteobacteria bacterium]MEA3260522.1 50S ribosomal protein L18 [Pseudomonadota bacterium]SMO83848.1 LSU ribosomal protein L18P [Alcanivorax sp. DSM 26295]MAK23546.1 50S ribosomal protein L18 [Alcanivorax sp.]|tara:strand:- start:26042 stop:26392 length:351 start_codon:yes stop_codon:yes gene_type:complete
MMDKKLARLRRAKRTRLNIRESGQIRLSVHRTPRHIYAQITSAAGDRVLVTASTVEKDLREAATGNADAASKVGELIAKRAKEAGIERVAFDRSGFRYHGRIKALADAARENGLEF